MISFSFQANKEACFTYWLQSLVRWSWYFEKKEYEYYSQFIKPLTEREKSILNDWKNFLQRKETGFLWLWQRYAQEPIVRPKEKEQELWNILQNTFLQKFESFWDIEALLLERWRILLSQYPTHRLEPMLSSVCGFLNVEGLGSKKIRVLLLPYANQTVPAGHANRYFPNLIILNVSHVISGHLDKVINVLIHETSHLFAYASFQTESLLKNSFTRIIAPTPFKKRATGPKWRYLLTETVITSIAGRDPKNYFSQKKQMTKNDALDSENRESWEQKGYSGKIRLVAQEILPLTTHYFDNAKVIDQDYCDAVAKTWIDFLKKSVK